MKLRSCFLAALASLAFSQTALADDSHSDNGPRPETGMGTLGTGSALAAIGALSFASAPLCKTGIVSTPQQGNCFAVSFLAGAPFLALGIPFIVFGAVQHAKYENWARQHPAVAGLSFSPTSGGGAVGWSARF